MESVVPLPSKSQANLMESAGSGSLEPSLEKLTASGARPLVGVAFRMALGARRPLT
jgi:hypothetical protein